MVNLKNGGEASEQDIEIAAQLRTVIHRLVKILRKQNRNQELLSLTERSTMSLLYQQGEMLPNELAQMERVTAQSMSQIINHLFSLNYILKNPSEEDKRKVRLCLSPEGKTYIETLREEKQEWLARSLQEKVSVEEKETLEKAMVILTKLIAEE